MKLLVVISTAPLFFFCFTARSGNASPLLYLIIIIINVLRLNSNKAKKSNDTSSLKS